MAYMKKCSSNRIIALVLLVITCTISTTLAQNSGTEVSATVSPKLYFDVKDASRTLSLDPTVTSPAITTGDLEVKANKAGWTIAVHSSDVSGRLVSGTTHLSNMLGVSASSITGGTGGSITPPLITADQVILSGNAHTQGPQTSTITYSQLSNWADNAALTYAITITFVGTSPS
jgi:hypothetical protein